MGALSNRPGLARTLAWILSLGVGLACFSAGSQAAVITYTEQPEGQGTIALGYPVPFPVESQTPVDGFRSYEALMARWQGLATLRSEVTALEIGRSGYDRPIHAYLLTSAQTTTPDGGDKATMLQNGGIHAREWASPEVVAQTGEVLLEAETEPGYRRYLLDHLRVLIVPVLNVDGFLQTQRYPNQALETEYAPDPDDWPRDGRMRRKNLRDTDEILCPADDPDCAVADGMNGVDPNRNHSPYWATGSGSSADSKSLVYHGAGPGSEPESQALYQAARVVGEDRLRFYLDTHSYSRLYYGVETENSRRNQIQLDLVTAMRAVTRNRYSYDPSPDGSGIGSTDEYFANRYQIPAYTLEIEPSGNGAVDYGGLGYNHDGFVLPESEIARVRDELAAATLLGAYRMAGPPALAEVEIRDSATGEVVFAGAWGRVGNASRSFAVSTDQGLRADQDYRLWIAFDKPMRVRNAEGEVAQYRGQSVALLPTLGFEGADAGGAALTIAIDTAEAEWLAHPGGAPDGYRRYADDAVAVGFRLSAASDPEQALRLALSVDVRDFSGLRLDADPSSVSDWSQGAWSGYEDSDGDAGDSGGVDLTVRVKDDGGPIPADGSASEGSSGGGGSPAPLLIGVLLICGLLARCSGAVHRPGIGWVTLAKALRPSPGRGRR